jgi:glycosyltransferase involved in cell wall biosynthesis
VRLALVVPGGVDRSGEERVIPALLWLVARLALRHDVHVVALRQEPEPATWPLLGAIVHNLGLPSGGLPGSGLLRFAPRLASLLARLGPIDIVHAFWAGTPAALSALATLRSGTPLVVHVAGGEVAAIPEIGYGGWLHRRERMKARFAFSRAARVTAGSRFLGEKLAALGVCADVVPLGADASLFSPGLEVDRDVTRLLHVASRNAVKDPPTLLTAFRQVVDAIPSARLDVVGEDVDGGAAARLADGLGLSSRVTFHGALSSARLAPMFRAACLLVQSSRWEAQGVAVLEAALAGTPTVGTAVGLVADLAPEAALATPPRNPVALADGILALLGDPDRRRALGRAARAFALAHDADATVAAFESIYRDLARR